ncbi:MAG: hypothetical protein EBV03_13075, partial [Proteobacteria bacterium]|nr:hypothetical protein [Pseudomonadota bacterium]
MKKTTTYVISMVALLALAAPAQAGDRHGGRGRQAPSPVEYGIGNSNTNAVQGYTANDRSRGAATRDDFEGMFYSTDNQGGYQAPQRPPVAQGRPR